MGVVYATIKERITTVEGDIELVCNNPTDVIEISFDDEWEGKTGFVARFAWANKYIEVPFTGNRVQVPEIVNTTYVFFGVYADNIASTPTKVNCKKSILCLGDSVRQPPANPFYDDFAERLENVEQAIKEGGGGSGLTEIPIASADRLGGIKVGANLLIDENGVLSVDTANVAQQDNTRPITSAAVHTELGNIEALLANI